MDRNKDGYASPGNITDSTYIRAAADKLFRVLGIFWKAARVGERLSPYVSLCCVIMAVSTVNIILRFCSSYAPHRLLYSLDHNTSDQSGSVIRRTIGVVEEFQGDCGFIHATRPRKTQVTHPSHSYET